ncbi:putative transcriptional regulator/transcriptional regulator with XRE-family HTH domain [Crossiella equi]|uniref:Transcriptional regulator/transcriptional regulator with XRE-family HTH domain n=1 Tax=Crossiella equi TaxID=130796 RepID=A0ABS5AQ19_9PSEU|nr:short-chain fatty acyl-CoA regulator family protein [Crossiella equi]MBP2478666.1 putative transcriptional regulator/transcriptional regulator with XRE-family HTH domain [Crossiella equi]
MAKTFVGARLRRLREGRGMNQVDLARALGISASYLNQIEHDSRPLTVPVLLRITETFGVDASFFAAQDSARLFAELREALPNADVSSADLRELASNRPELARAVLGLARRNRELDEQLSVVLGDRAAESLIGTHERVRDFFYTHANHFTHLDTAAEQVAGAIGIRPGEVRSALAARLAEKHGIHVRNIVGDVAHNASSGELHHYDSITRTLSLSLHMRPGQQAFRMATQVALLEFAPELDAIVAESEEPDGPVRALIRIGLARYAAAALVMPYRNFHETAERLRYDIELLADHFAMGFETICHRLTTLQRPGALGVPFSFVRVDRAGNVSKRQSATGFHFSRSGGTCPLWSVYSAFSAPGRVITQVAAMPDGQRYFWVARTVARSRGGYASPGKTFAVGLGCEIRHASRLVYSSGTDLDDASAATPIGPGCQTCERPLCPQRSAPPIGKPLRVDENRSTFVPYPLEPVRSW